MNTSLPFFLSVVAVVAYFIGSTPFGYLIGRAKGLDIRKHGSGNIGATNVRRVIGKKAGILCFALDFLKGLVPVAIVLFLQRLQWVPSTSLAPVVAAVGVVAGHIWTVFLNFKGGKGIATSAGAVMALAPFPVIIAAIIWFLVFLPSRYVSLASIAAAVSLPVSALLLRIFTDSRIPGITVGLLFLLAALAILRHRSNISRLRNGTENRFTKDSSDTYVTLKKPSNPEP